MSKNLTEDEIRGAIYCTSSMSAAAAYLHTQFSTFKRYATKFDLYTPNQGGVGVAKRRADGSGKIPITEILDGKHPQYQTFKLKHRLFEMGLKKNSCEQCGTDKWNGETLQCELDHIDGDPTNHRFSNLRIMCPNCHSQTTTFRFKRGKSA